MLGQSKVEAEVWLGRLRAMVTPLLGGKHLRETMSSI